MSPPRLIPLGLAVVVIAVSGCTHVGRAQGAHLRATALGSIRSVALGEAVGPPQMDDDRLVYPAGADRSAPWDRVLSIDLDSGRSTVVARTAYDAGMINWAVPAGSFTVYVDQSAEQSDAQMNVLWRIWAVDPATTKKVLLATNGQLPDEFVPKVQAQGGYVFWDSQSEHGTTIWLWRPDWAQPRSVLTSKAIRPESESIGSAIVYVGPPAKTPRGTRIRGDCWTVPLTGGRPTLLTRSGSVTDCTTDRRWLVWRQRVKPARGEATYQPDAPNEIWYQETGHEAHRLAAGEMDYTYPHVANGILVWTDSHGEGVIQNLAELTQRRSIHLPNGMASDTFGSDRWLGFVTEPESAYADTAHLINLRK